MAIPGCNRRDRQEEKNPQCSGKSQKTKLGVCNICKGGEEGLVMGQQEQVGSRVCSCKFGFWANFLSVVTELKVLLHRIRIPAPCSVYRAQDALRPAAAAPVLSELHSVTHSYEAPTGIFWSRRADKLSKDPLEPVHFALPSVEGL